MSRQVASFQIFAKFRVVGGHGDDFVVGRARIHHGHNSNGTSLNEGQRLYRFLAQNQHIEGIVVLGIGLRNETVIRGIENRRMNNTIDFEQAGGFVQFVFNVGAERDFDDRLKIAGNILARRNIMPSVEHSGKASYMKCERNIIACAEEEEKLSGKPRPWKKKVPHPFAPRGGVRIGHAEIAVSKPTCHCRVILSWCCFLLVGPGWLCRCRLLYWSHSLPECPKSMRSRHRY